MQKNSIEVPDIVITVGTAVGSSLALVEAITTKIGCKAYILCTDEKASKILSKSKFIEEVCFIKGESEEVYIASIKKWYKEKNFSIIPILYFSTDTSCFYIDKHRDWFEHRFKLCLPSSDIIRKFTNKGIAEPEALKHGLIIPKSLFVNSEKKIEEVIRNFKFPLILKPQATYLKNNIDFKIKVIEDQKDFVRIAQNYIDSEKFFLCQEFIPGGNDCSYYYLFYRSKTGFIKENIGKKTLQSTPNGGIMLKGKSEFNKDLSLICQNFLESINYEGIGGIEFKKYNNKFYFIEMSVRLEGFFKINEISKSHISLTSYYDLVEKIFIPNGVLKSKQIDGYIYMAFMPTMLYFMKNKRVDLLIIEALKSVFSPRVKLDIFSYKSISPFFYQIIQLLKGKYK